MQYTVGDFQVATLYEKWTGELQQSGTVALNTGYYDACVTEELKYAYILSYLSILILPESRVGLLKYVRSIISTIF